jgi:hypothetical protein
VETEALHALQLPTVGMLRHDSGLMCHRSYRACAEGSTRERAMATLEETAKASTLSDRERTRNERR